MNSPWKCSVIIVLFYLHFLSIQSYSTEEYQSITTESPEDRLIREFIEGVKMLQTNRKQLQTEKSKLRAEKRKLQQSIKMNDVIQFNVGGDILMATRASLTRVPSSNLAVLLNGRWEHKFNNEIDGILFLDFDPSLFRHLLDQLRTLKNINTPIFSPPQSSSSRVRRSFELMLQKLNLKSSPASVHDTIVMNIGGQQLLTTRRRLTESKLVTLLSKSSIKLSGSSIKEASVFVDANPYLFHHIIEQLREEQWMKSIHFKIPNFELKNVFSSMFKTFGFLPRLTTKSKWGQSGLTIAGTGSCGSGSSQLYNPMALFLDADKTILVADYSNNRIVSWKLNSTLGTTVVGGKGSGSRIDQLNNPTTVIIDQKHDKLIISEIGNRRIMEWAREENANGSLIMSGIQSYGIAMDNEGFLYVSDHEKHEVRKYRLGETNGTVVAGGKGQGSALNQLNSPTGLFIDEEQSVYVTDTNNHRVIKWPNNSTEGIIVAGGRGYGSGLTQLYYPRGVVVDSIGSVYVADQSNHRIMRWPKDAKEGNLIVGGNGAGSQSHQIYHPFDLALDNQGSLIVVDYSNCRIQQFNIEKY